MRVASWNLNGLDDRDADVRCEAAMLVVLLGEDPMAVLGGGRSAEPPDVVALQEVTPRMLAAHVRPHLTAAGFTVFPRTLGDREYGCVLASRIPAASIARSRFTTTRYGRELLGVRLSGGTTVWTAHLDSLRDGGRERRAQLREVFARMGAGPAVFVGDTNLRDHEVTLPDGIADAWAHVGAAREHRTTWRRGRAAARFDRAYIAGLVPTGFRTFGGAPLDATGEPPSDHLGIEVRVGG